MEENLFPGGGALAGQAEIEEERRLFYVAITRAMRAVTVSYSVSRMRNGQHENNPPSRFLKEIAPQYLDRPIESAEPSFGGQAFRSLLQRSAPRPESFNYGRSSTVRYEKHPSTPVSAPPAQPSIRRPGTPPPPEIDPDFVAVPMTELYEGERVEHNRFGPGKILEITGTVPELKARIVFDRYGEKLLLLKYAKLRPER